MRVTYELLWCCITLMRPDSICITSWRRAPVQSFSVIRRAVRLWAVGEYRPEKKDLQKHCQLTLVSLCVCHLSRMSSWRQLLQPETNARVLSGDRFTSPPWKDSFTKTLKVVDIQMEARTDAGGPSHTSRPLARIHVDAVRKLYSVVEIKIKAEVRNRSGRTHDYKYSIYALMFNTLSVASVQWKGIVYL